MVNLTNFTTSTVITRIGNTPIVDMNVPLTFQSCQELCVEAVATNAHNTIILFFVFSVLLWLCTYVAYMTDDVFPKKVLSICIHAGFIFTMAFMFIVLYLL